jgi:hypothetical protein
VNTNGTSTLASGSAVPTYAPGTAIEFLGATGGSTIGAVNANAAPTALNSYLGTDAAGGDFNGTGLNGYAIGSWGSNASAAGLASAIGAGEVLTYNGTTAYLTQAYSNLGGQIYYAGNITNQDPNNTGSINHIVTGSGNNDWIHGIGAATAASYSPAPTSAYQYDVAYGGAGDDHIGIVGLNFTRVNGNEGWNTLVFEGKGINLNLATQGLAVENFQQFDLNNQENTTTTDPQGKFTGLTTGNTLSLRLSDVLSEGNVDNQLSPGSSSIAAHTAMTIMGDSSSTVQLLTSTGAPSTVTSTASDGTATATSSGWAIAGSQNIGTVSYDLWVNSADTTKASELLIQHGINVI